MRDGPGGKRDSLEKKNFIQKYMYMGKRKLRRGASASSLCLKRRIALEKGREKRIKEKGKKKEIERTWIVKGGNQ